MPSLITPNRPLSKRDLPTALSSAKTQTYSDAPPAPTNTRSLRGAPPPSSSPAATSQIRTLAWSPLGNLIATADARTLRVWNPERPGVRFSTELKPPASSTQAAAATVTTGTGGKPPPPQNAPAHLTGTERVAWNSAREAELASVGSDGTVRFWDVRTKGQCVGEVKVGGEGFSMAWRKGGEEMVVGRKVSLGFQMVERSEDCWADRGMNRTMCSSRFHDGSCRYWHSTNSPCRRIRLRFRIAATSYSSRRAIRR